MNISNVINVIDTNAIGHPIRFITGGMPPLYGKTMNEKMTYMKDHHDWIRKAVLWEPRGFESLMAGVVTEATNSRDHFGLFYMYGHPKVYLPIAGVPTITLGRILVATGMVPLVEPETEVRLDTSMGSVSVFVKVDGGEALEATLENEASFVYETHLNKNVAGIGQVSYDISFGGYPYALIDVESLGLRIDLSSKKELTEVGTRIIQALSGFKMSHPVQKELTYGLNVMFYKKSKDPDGAYKTQVVFAGGEFDRSPCGTGTCAWMAWLYKNGELGLNEECVNKNALDTRLKGLLKKETKAGKFEAVIPRITGSGYITGFNQLILERDDSLKYGWSDR